MDLINVRLRLLLFFLLFSLLGYGETLIFKGDKIEYPGTQLSHYIDNSEQLKASEILLLNEFSPLQSAVPNLGVSNKKHWIKLELQNTTSEKLVIHIPYPVLDHIGVYFFEGDVLLDSTLSGLQYPFSTREINHQDFLFKIPQSKNRLTILFCIKNNSQSMLPLTIGTQEQINSRLFNKDHFFGIYVGFILVMLFYNLFIFLSTKDENYITYLIYIFTVGITQFTLAGYSQKYLWPDWVWLSKNSVYLCGISSGLAVIFFVQKFLHVKENLPWFNKLLQAFIGMYLVALLLMLFGFPTLSYNLINITAGLGVLVLFVAAIQIAQKGFRPARFFVVAWTIFIFSIIIFVLKDVGVLPYNDFTVYALPIGSAIEVVLLSLALADKINVLTVEKDLARANELHAVKQNEKLVLEQNIMLEQKVAERTTELEKANKSLEVALESLKNAQAQLVNQEKMASLGQLTAGIAHEINNPINFVSSNVNPLRRDIDDLIGIIEKFLSIKGSDNLEERISEIQTLKEEIDYEYILEEVDQLLKGIGEGASRTAEIVKSLKNFSRLDEVESKFADIHEGIDSTLVIIISGTKQDVEIIKNYDPKINPIECYPGKLNQVISNIIVNSLQALQELGADKKGELEITTKDLGDSVSISIKDNGPGISKEHQTKIFEPFFTTKEVGEGTGLGLSIVFSIIELHKGKIELISDVGKGAEFLITLPKALQ